MTTDPLAHVSRETIARLEHFADLVRKWTPKINLISRTSVDDLWDRHILDSAQVFQQATEWKKWVDLGSGGGFPGIVIAILALEQEAAGHVVLVESDQRKCAFLRTAIRELGLKAQVETARIEALEPQGADILSARALADLSQLLAFADRHLIATGTALFPKGATWREEHEKAQEVWSYRCEVVESLTNPSAAILKIKEISRV